MAGARPLKLTDFEALTFDVVGTLIDFETGILAALRPWLAAHGVAAGDEDLLAMVGAGDARHGAENPGETFTDALPAIFAAIAARWNVPAGDNDAEAFRDSVRDWPAFPDSRDALAYLRRHYTLVALTNAGRGSFEFMNAKLGDPFDAAVTADAVGAVKPDERMFRRALDELAAMGIAKERILHTAQSQYHDIVPAKALGLATMWVHRRHDRPGWGASPPPRARVEPDFTVPSMADFVARHRALVGD